MAYTRIIVVALAIGLLSSAARAELVQLDFFSEGQGAQPDVEFSVTLDSNTGFVSYTHDPSFFNVSTHGTLRVGETTVLDAAGLSHSTVGTDEGISYVEMNAFGVEARFNARVGDGPDNGFFIPEETPSQVHLVVDAGVYYPEAFEPYFAPSFIRYDSTEVPLTRLTVTIIPEPSMLALAAAGIGIVRRRRRIIKNG